MTSFRPHRHPRGRVGLAHVRCLVTFLRAPPPRRQPVRLGHGLRRSTQQRASRLEHQLHVEADLPDEVLDATPEPLCRLSRQRLSTRFRPRPAVYNLERQVSLC